MTDTTLNLKNNTTHSIFSNTAILRQEPKNLAFLIVSPFTSLILNFINLCKSLYYSKVLLKGSWKHFLAFDPGMSCLRTFYLVQINNINRYGLKGFSPTLGGGFELNIFWYQSLFSLRAFKALGLALILAALFFWLLSFFIWSNSNIELLWCCTVIFLTLASSNFAGNLLSMQNYNALGWAFMPLSIWALFTNSFITLFILLILIAYSSITVLVLTCFIILLYSLLLQNFLCLTVLILPTLKILVDIYYYLFFNSKYGKNKLVTLLKFIGANRKSEYKRPIRILLPFCLACILLAFPFVVYFREVNFFGLNKLHIMAFSSSPIVILFLNQSGVFRFADIQTMLMFFLTISATITMLSQDWIIAFTFWLVNSNGIISYILFASSSAAKDIILSIPALKPFDFRNIEQFMYKFLSSIPATNKIFIANQNPQGNYNKLWDGYCNQYQALCYCADNLQISIVPDWYSTMYKPSPYYWGTNPGEVKACLVNLNIEYCVLYFSHQKLMLLDEFIRQGFQPIQYLYWNEMLSYLPDGKFKESSSNLTWVLVRYKTT